jgi:hypothetical protein
MQIRFSQIREFLLPCIVSFCSRYSHLVDMQLANSNWHLFWKLCMTPVSSTAHTGL